MTADHTRHTPPPEPTPLPERVWKTFTAPARLFPEFRLVTPWVGALGILVLIGLFVAFSTPLELLVQQAEEAAARAGDAELISDPETIARWGRYINALAALVAYPIIAFGVAGAVTLIFSVILGGKVSFPQYLTATTHALLVWGLGILVTQIVHVFTRDFTFSASIALLLPFLSPETFTYRLLDGMNIFSLWAIGLLGYAVGVLDDERGPLHPTAILLALYIGLAVVLAVVEGRVM